MMSPGLRVPRAAQESLSIVDVSTGAARSVPGYTGFEILDVSSDGEFMQSVVFGLDLRTGVTQTHKRPLDKRARIEQIAAAAEGTLFCVFDDGSLARVSADWQVAWRSSFPALAAQGTTVRFPSQCSSAMTAHASARALTIRRTTSVDS